MLLEEQCRLSVLEFAYLMPGERIILNLLRRLYPVIRGIDRLRHTYCILPAYRHQDRDSEAVSQINNVEKARF